MKANVLIRKLLGVTVMTRSRTGFLIAVVTGLAIAGDAALASSNFLSRNDAFVCIGLGLLGFLGWLTGRVREASQAESPVQEAPAAEAAEEHSLAFLRSLKYWGVILVFLAGVLSSLAAWRRPAFIVHARSLPVTTITVTNVVTLTNEAPRLVFPSLELQGVIVNGARSSALISGRLLGLGEGISNAVLVAVDSQHAFVVMGGQTNALVLRK